jgi:hypothetical protein
VYGKCGSSRTDANQRRQIGWFGSYNCNNGGGDQSLCADPAPLRNGAYIFSAAAMITLQYKVYA